MNLKKEILKNTGINEELNDEDKQEIKSGILSFMSTFPKSQGFSSLELKNKIGLSYSDEDVNDAIADLIIDGYLIGKTYSFFITHKGRRYAEFI